MTRQGGWPPTGFGTRLRELRQQQGLSQAELAEKAGCHRFTVAKTERGEQEPAWPLALALARALGVEVGAFVIDNAPTHDPARGRKPGRIRKAPAGQQDGSESGGQGNCQGAGGKSQEKPRKGRGTTEGDGGRHRG